MKSCEVEGAQGTALLGAELPGQMPRITGAILGGKAQEQIPDQAREPVGIYGCNLGQVSNKRRVLSQDFVQWEGTLRPPRTHAPCPVLVSLLGCELMSLEG